jgi:hypothetical protein
VHYTSIFQILRRKIRTISRLENYLKILSEQRKRFVKCEWWQSFLEDCSWPPEHAFERMVGVAGLEPQTYVMPGTFPSTGRPEDDWNV